MTRNNPTRRDILKSSLLAGAGASALALNRPSLTGAHQPGRGLTRSAPIRQDSASIRWAVNNTSPAEVGLVQQVVDQFLETHPNWDISVSGYDPNNYDQLLMADIAAGTVPDIFTSADIFTKPFFEVGLTADLVPLAAETGFNLDDFDPNFLDLARFEGKVGFLPRAADVVVVYYNRRMFDDAGISYPTPEWTWDEFMEISEALTIKADDGSTLQYGCSTDTTWWAFWVPLVLAEGGQILNEDNTEAIFNSEEGMRAWNYIFTGLTNGWWLPRSTAEALGGSNVPFMNGTGAMHFSVRALTPSAREQLADDWDVQIVPQGSVTRSTGMGTMGYAMSAASKDLSATWELLEYTYTEGMRFFMESYLVVPPIQTFYDDPAWRDLPPPPHNTDAFISALDHAVLPPPLPFYSTGAFRQAMEDGVDAVLLGQMSPEDAVNNMAMEATRALQM